MPFESDYRSKLKSAQEAVRLVESGMRLWLHSNSGYPAALVNALAERAGELRDVEICHLLTYNKIATAEPRCAGSFRHNCWFIGADMRSAVAEGRADFVPVHLGHSEALVTSGLVPIDVAFIQVSPPDEHGYVNLGAAVECTTVMARAARKVIAQVNRRVPRTCGQSSLHIREIDVFVEQDEPLFEFSLRQASEVETRIGRHIATLIEDGATLQIGVGGVPDAVLACLKDRRDLGVHSEIITDALLPLIEAGVITGARKTLHPHKVVVGFCAGTRRLYEFVDGNPGFEFLTQSYVNDPRVIAQNDRMVAVNSALEIDLTGQVCADSVGQQVISGFGGQGDFIRGAAMARDGKPVIALPATAKNGTVSRIVPMLKPGAGVVTTRADVRWVATEFGLVNLFGRNIRRRAELLISIAHPDFRQELYEHCVGARWFQRNELTPRSLSLGAS